LKFYCHVLLTRIGLRLSFVPPQVYQISHELATLLFLLDL
jgi:hypothetical protein